MFEDQLPTANSQGPNQIGLGIGSWELGIFVRTTVPVFPRRCPQHRRVHRGRRHVRRLRVAHLACSPPRAVSRRRRRIPAPHGGYA